MRLLSHLQLWWSAFLFYSCKIKLTSLAVDNYSSFSAVYIRNANDENDICSGKYQLVFMSPEGLLTDDLRWRDMLQSSVC